MATTHNPRKSTKYPAKFNQRENRASTHNNSLLVTNTETVALATDDAISFVRNTGTSTVTLPPAAENTGRCICFLQTDAATLTIAQNASGENIDGADASFTALDAADDWAELFCTGSEWIITKQHIAP